MSTKLTEDFVSINDSDIKVSQHKSMISMDFLEYYFF